MGPGLALCIWDGYKGSMGLGEWSLSGGDRLFTGIYEDLHGMVKACGGHVCSGSSLDLFTGIY